MTVKTSKSEDMCLVNDVDSHIIIFSWTSNLRVLCTQVKEIIIHGTFKCCPKFFEQLYTIHGYSNCHYIPLVFALLVSKSEDPRCTSFAYYILENYIVRDSRFPPTLWSSLPSLNAKRTTNGAESFHAHYTEQFYAAHSTIFIFLDVLSKIQTTTYVKVRTIHMPESFEDLRWKSFLTWWTNTATYRLTRSTDTSLWTRWVLCH